MFKIMPKIGNFFPKITFNKHTYRDSQVLNIYGIQLFLPRIKEKTNTAAIRIGSRQSMPAHVQLIPLFKAEKNNRRKFPTEQELGAQRSGEDGRDSSVSHGKYVY